MLISADLDPQAIQYLPSDLHHRGVSLKGLAYGSLLLSILVARRNVAACQ